MNHEGKFEELSISVLLRIDQVCDEFEAAWRSGASPRIEAYLTDLSDRETEFALAELSRLERELHDGRLEHHGSSPEAPVKADNATLVDQAGTPTVANGEVLQQVPTSAVSSDPPARIGRYNIEDKVGQGSFGIVYLARNVDNDRHVAIKIPSSGRARSSQDIARFLDEARNAAQLEHPGIVRVHEFGKDDKTPYIVQEFIDGENLAASVKHRRWTPDQIAELVAHVAEAIAFAHENGVFHRDLKPENILIDSQGKPRIADFGLALHEGFQRYRPGEFAGTISYMSPEQVRGESHRLDGRADIWAVGVILYELLCGRRPFSGSREQLVDEILNREPRPPRQIDPNLSPDLERLCLKCLAKPIKERFSTALDVADALRQFLSTRGHVDDIPQQDWKGRSRVRLKELVSLWRRSDEKPLLPSALEYVRILIAVPRHRRLSDEEAFLKLARRRWFLRCVVASTALCATSVAFVATVRGTKLSMLIERLMACRDSIVLDVVDELKEYGGSAQRALRSELDQPTLKGRLRVAIALAHFGEHHVATLCDGVLATNGTDCGNIVSALRNSSLGRDELLRRTRECAESDNATRYAIVSVHLGDVRGLRLLVKPKGDPVNRTAFIHGFPGYHDDLGDVLVLLKLERASDVRSAICKSLSLIPKHKIATPLYDRLVEALRRIFESSPDAGSHSAARYALQQWNSLPTELPAVHESDAFDWFYNDLGMLLVRLPAGAFPRGAGVAGAMTEALREFQRVTPQQVDVEPFMMSAFEVTVGDFRRFVADKDVSADRKPTRWNKDEPDSYPARFVTWYNAVEFCNWASKREGLSPAYVADGSTSLPLFPNGPRVEYPNWQLAPRSNGYRLPTSDEWEYACRAGSRTTYPFGPAELRGLMNEYAWTPFNTPKREPKPRGTRLPNDWGLFDMLGNVSEWCWNQSLRDPERRTMRGGSARVSTHDDLLCGCLADGIPTIGPAYQGFRLVRTDS